MRHSVCNSFSLAESSQKSKVYHTRFVSYQIIVYVNFKRRVAAILDDGIGELYVALAQYTGLRDFTAVVVVVFPRNFSTNRSLASALILTLAVEVRSRNPSRCLDTYRPQDSHHMETCRPPRGHGVGLSPCFQSEEDLNVDSVFGSQ